MISGAKYPNGATGAYLDFLKLKCSKRSEMTSWINFELKQFYAGKLEKLKFGPGAQNHYFGAGLPNSELNPNGRQGGQYDPLLVLPAVR